MKLLKLVPDNTNIDFMRWRNVALVLSILVTIASLVLVGVRGLNLGIDFVGGQVVRGRIDAAFPEDDGGWLLVDWKTNRRHDAHAWQLAVYRMAWAQLHDVPLDRVRAGFYYVRDGVLDVVTDLPGPDDLARVLFDA